MNNQKNKSKKIAKFWAMLPLTILGVGFCSHSVTAQIIKTEQRDGKKYVTYKVQAQENAKQLAEDFKITLDELAAANPNKDLKYLKYSETIIIPQDPDPKTNHDNELTRGSENAQGVVKHISKNNENLFTIAKKYGITAMELRSWNNLAKDVNKVDPGQELIVRVGSKKNVKKNIENRGTNTMQVANNNKDKNQKNLAANLNLKNNQGKTRGENTQEESKNEPIYDTLRTETIERLEHTINEKETLAFLARINNTTQEEILKASNLDLNYKVKTGDKLVIPSKKITYQIIQKSENDFPDVEPTEYIVKAKENLTMIAQNHHVSVKELKLWNNIPENSDVIKENQKLKIYLPIYEHYTVKQGDTWESIAGKYGLSQRQIMLWNNIEEGEPAIKDQKIDIFKPAKKNNKKSYANPKQNPNQNSDKNLPKPNAVVKYHHIEEGDNFSKVRTAYNISSTEIKFWNNRKFDDDNLFVGDSLKLYLPIEKIHIVKKGETPNIIAKMYEVNTSQIRIWNNLKVKNEQYEYDVTEGQNLKIFEPTGPKPTKEFLDSKPKKNTQNTSPDNKKEEPKKEENKNINENPQGIEIKKHIVQKEETLYKLSKMYNVSPDDIKKWNNLTSPNIKLDDVLVIYPQPNKETAKTNTPSNTIVLHRKKPNGEIGNNGNSKLGDGSLKVETPNPDADPLHQLSESTITNVTGGKNNDNDINKDPENKQNNENNNDNIQIVTIQGLIQYNQDVRGDERFSVFVREDKKEFASVDITNPKTGTMVTASVAGVISHSLTPSIIMEVTPEIMRALGFDLSDVPSIKMEFKK